MKDLNKLLTELGISKVRLSKYLGVSRQMLYNYLAFDSLKKWPKEKIVKLLSLLDIKDENEITKIKITGEYIRAVENRLNNGLKDKEEDKGIFYELKGFNKKEQELLTDVINLLKEKLNDNKTKEVQSSLTYLYNFLQSMETTKEVNFILAYMSKSLGFTDPNEFAFDSEQQYIFESIMFSAMTLYNNGGASKKKLEETHKKFIEDIEHKKEEKLSRTQELNTAKVQALKELGYEEINESNAKEVLEKIAEIQSRKV